MRSVLHRQKRLAVAVVVVEAVVAQHQPQAGGVVDAAAVRLHQRLEDSGVRQRHLQRPLRPCLLCRRLRPAKPLIQTPQLLRVAVAEAVVVVEPPQQVDVEAEQPLLLGAVALRQHLRVQRLPLL